MVSSLQTERLEWTQRLQNADLRIRAQPDPPGVALISFLLDFFHAFLDRLVLLKVSSCLKKVFALSAARRGGVLIQVIYKAPQDSVFTETDAL